ncbi:hypothetical protein RSAG8_10709, partial [Rhizoctonia solani AG-8 WAC10335]
MDNREPDNGYTTINCIVIPIGCNINVSHMHINMNINVASSQNSSVTNIPHISEI